MRAAKVMRADQCSAADAAVPSTHGWRGLVVDQTGALKQTIPNELCFINTDKKLQPGNAVPDFSKASSVLSFGSADDGINQMPLWNETTRFVTQTAA